MKNLGKLVFVLSIFLMVGCSKDMESRLPGTWDFSQTYSYSNQSMTVSGSITFNEDGTGTVTPSGSSTMDFEWTSNEDKSITIDGESFTNTKNKRKEQEFTNSTGDEFLSLTKD